MSHGYCYIERLKNAFAERAILFFGILLKQPVQFLLADQALQPTDNAARQKTRQARRPCAYHFPDIYFQHVVFGHMILLLLRQLLSWRITKGVPQRFSIKLKAATNWQN